MPCVLLGCVVLHCVAARIETRRKEGGLVLFSVLCSCGWWGKKGMKSMCYQIVLLCVTGRKGEKTERMVMFSVFYISKC